MITEYIVDCILEIHDFRTVRANSKKEAMEKARDNDTICVELGDMEDFIEVISVKVKK